MEKIETENFYNNGFGWICKNCERELNLLDNSAEKKHSRLMSEGEAESKKTQFSSKALAKWSDETKSKLICPRCGITERKINGR